MLELRRQARQFFQIIGLRLRRRKPVQTLAAAGQLPQFSIRKYYPPPKNVLGQTRWSSRPLRLCSLSSREIGLSHVVQASPIPSAQSVVHDMHYSKPVVSILSSLVGDNANNIHCLGMFHNGPDERSTSGSHQTLSFRWE